MLRKIFGPVYNKETRTYERRHNVDLQKQNMYGRLNNNGSKRVETREAMSNRMKNFGEKTFRKAPN